MTGTDWPAGLPPLGAQLSDVRAATVARAQMDVGPAKQRRRFTTGWRYISPNMLLTGAERATLDAFYKTAMEEGSQRWRWYDPASGELCIFRFIAPIEYRAMRPDPSPSARIWSAALKLEILPFDPVDIPDLLAWWNPDDAAARTLDDAGRFLGMLDLSGNGQLMQPSPPSQRPHLSNLAFGSHAALGAVPADQTYFCTFTETLFADPPYMVAAVLRLEDNGDLSQPLAYWDLGGFSLRASPAGATVFLNCGNNFIETTYSEPHVVLMQVTNDSEGWISVDGVRGFQFLDPPEFESIRQFFMCNGAGFGPEFTWNGPIGQTMIIRGVPSDPVVLAVENYLTRWARS